MMLSTNTVHYLCSLYLKCISFGVVFCYVKSDYIKTIIINRCTMFKITTTLLLTALLFISTSVFAISTSEKAVKIAKNKTAEFVQVVELTADEEEQIYNILLAKEQNTLAAREEHKGDKQAFKAATKPFNKKANRQVKDIIGKDRMKKMNQFYAAKRSANKK